VRVFRLCVCVVDANSHNAYTPTHHTDQPPSLPRPCACSESPARFKSTPPTALALEVRYWLIGLLTGGFSLLLCKWYPALHAYVRYQKVCVCVCVCFMQTWNTGTHMPMRIVESTSPCASAERSPG
jgi:hypothetical protein